MNMAKTNVSEMKDCVNQFVQVVEELKYKRKVCNQQEIEIETLLKRKLELENVNHDLSNNLTSVKSFADKLQLDKEVHKSTSKEDTSLNDKHELQSQLNSANSVITSMKKENSELHLQNHQKKSALEIAEQKYLSLEKTYSFVKEKVEHLKEETNGLKNAQKNFRSVYETLKENLEAVKNINKNLVVKLKHKDCVYAALNEKKKLLDAKIVELETKLTQNSNLENGDKNLVVLSLKSELKLFNEKYEALSKNYKTLHEELKMSESALKLMTESNKTAHGMLLQQSMQDALIDELKERLHDQKQRNSELENRVKMAEDKTIENKLKSVIGEKEKEISLFQSEIIQLKDESSQKSSNILTLNIEISSLQTKYKEVEEKLAEILEEKKAKEWDTKQTQTLDIVDDEFKGKGIEEKSQSINKRKNVTETSICSIADEPQDSPKVMSLDEVDTATQQEKLKSELEEESKTDISSSSKCVIDDDQVDVSSVKVDLSPILLTPNNDFKQVKNLPEVSSAVFNISDLNTQTVKCGKVSESHLENLPMNNEFECINNLQPPEEFISTWYDVSQIRNAEKRKICSEQDSTVEEMKISEYVGDVILRTSQENKLDSSRVDAFVIPDSPMSVSSGPTHDNIVDNRLIAVVSPRIKTKRQNPVPVVEKTDPPPSAQVSKDEKITAKTPKVIPILQHQDGKVLTSLVLSDKKRAKKRKILSCTPPMLEDLEPCTQTQEETNVKVSYKSNLSSVTKFSKDVKSSATELRRRNSNTFSHRYYSPDPVDINDISDNEEDSQSAFQN